jgi:hypothetical protein
VAMGDLRALRTSHVDSACAVDHPVGCRRIERHAPLLGPVYGNGGEDATIDIPGLGKLQTPLHGWPMSPPKGD